MMRDFSDALGDYDVWVAPYGDSRERLIEPPPEAPDGGGGPAGDASARRSAQSQLFQLANHACYPAVAVRNGFGDDGLPTGMIFMGKPFSETQILAVAKAYQDSTDYHLRTPELRG
jgi:Asp-tRNA(Asn)/Glu-tRNA(Gln) amidotransferase A subunit family amidase